MPRSGATAQGGFTTSGGFNSPWGSGGSGPVTPDDGGPEKKTDTGATPGTFNFPVNDPGATVGAMAANAGEAGNFLDGMSKAIFGTDKHTFLQGLFGEGNGSLLGGVPVIGDAARFAGGIPGGVGDTLKNVADVAGGAFEHMGTPGNASAQEMQDAYDKLPPDIKAEFDKQIELRPDIKPHIQTLALRAKAEQDQETNPKLDPFDSVPRATLADTLGYMLGTWLPKATGATHLQRGIGGIGSASDRVDQIIAIGNGGAPTGILGGDPTLDPTEQTVFEKITAGEWTKNQALDFLYARGEVLSRDKGVNIVGSMLLDPSVLASAGLAEVAKAGTFAAAVVKAEQGASEALHIGGAFRRTNVLAKGAQAAANTERGHELITLLGKTYLGLEGTTMGKAAKVTRTLIDPLHALGEHRVAAEQNIDLLGVVAPRAYVEAYGDIAYNQVAHYASSASADGAMLDMIAEDLSTVSGNVARDTVLELHQDAMLASVDTARELATGPAPRSIVLDLLDKAPLDIASMIKQKVISVRQLVWDEAADRNLAERLASMYGVKTVEDFAKDVAKMGREAKGLLHALTYGRATRLFLDAIEQSRDAYTGAIPLNRAILLSRGTLTNISAKGLLKRLAAAKTLAERASIIRAEQELYGELRYVALDNNNLPRTVARFEDWLTKRLEEGVIPSQLTQDEIARLPQPLRDMIDQLHGAWDIGFSPEDDLKWGLHYGTEGEIAKYTMPWADHVAPTTAGFRPTRQLLYNIAGQPIPNSIVRGAMTPIDQMAAMANTIKARVTSAQITEAARARFVAGAITKYGLNSVDAQKAFQALIEHAGLHKTSARGLREGQMWEGVERVLPRGLVLSGDFTKRDFMNLVLDAYEGDLRFVGLTQKFTGRAKKLLGPVGGNMAGWMAEYMYPRLKYQANAMFQVQERIEPIVLNAQRGVNFAFGNKMSEEDRISNAMLERMAETGITRVSDIDQAELSAQALIGSGVTTVLKKAIPQHLWNTLSDVQGVKRVNLLRTFQHKLGTELRDVANRAQPGLWDELKASYSQAAGRVLSDDDVAVRWVAEQMFGNDVKLANRLIRPGDTIDVFKNAISQAEFHRPGNLGELKALELDTVAKMLGRTTSDGRIINSAHDIRAAIAANELTVDQITDDLLTLGAHPDYVRRVEGALNFSWDTFWGNVRTRFNLSDGELRRVQGMMAKSAEVRGMTPVDFLSQVFSPYVEAGSEAAINDISKAVSVLRAPFGKDVAKLTHDDLMGQLADVFFSHLDPSGREALLSAFERELPGDIQAAYNARRPGAGRALQGTLEKLRGPSQGNHRAVFPDAGMYDHTAANGGGTFDVATGQEMGLSSGYGVGNGLDGVIVDNTKDAVDAAYAEVSKTGVPNIGTWVNPETGKVHVDPTEVVMDEATAMKLAQERGELAIHDFATHEDIPVPAAEGPLRGAHAGRANRQFADAVLERAAHYPSDYKLSSELRAQWTAAGVDADTVDVIAGLIEARAGRLGVNADDLMKNVTIQAADAVPAEGVAQLQMGVAGPHTEMVPVSALLPAVRENREFFPRAGAGATSLDELTARIGSEGFDPARPVVLRYDATHHSVYLEDGNHRIAAAQRLGLKEVPAVVISGGASSKIRSGSMHLAGDSVDIPRGELARPSQLGIEGKPVAQFQGAVDSGATIAERTPRTAGAVEPVGAEATGSAWLRSQNEAWLNQPAPKALVDAGMGDSSPLVWHTMEDGREVAIPGGFDGTFSLWDAWRLKSQHIDPNLLDTESRIKLYTKLFRSQARELSDPVDTFNRVAFAMISPNLSLIKNESGLAAIRATSLDDVRAIAEMPHADLVAKVKASGAESVYPAQLATLQTNARRFVENPDWFKVRAGEDLIAYSERVMSVLDGAGMKVGNFAAELGDPMTFNRGTIDTRMVARMAREKRVPQELIDRHVNKADGGFIAPKADLIPVTLRGKPNPAVPEHLRDLPWVRKDGKVVAFGKDYKTFSDALDGILKTDYPGLPFRSGGGQWFLWDMERGIVEPHTTIFPGSHALPKMDPEQIKVAQGQAKEAGYFAKSSSKRVPYDPAKGVFYQGGGQAGPRGFTVQGANETIIGLTKTADPSTAVHELWHGILEPSLLDEERAVLEAHGAIGEQGAQMFETYMSSGKAPTPALRTVFAKAKRFMVAVYTKIKGSPLKAKLHPDVKAVFDSMLTPARDPDVERAVQQFSKWSKSAMTDGLLTSGANPYSDLLGRVAKIETRYATPFNKTHQLLVNGTIDAMRAKEQDAFRLTYFARNRSWLERSVNHPFFGIYPSSYMWGKIAPEVIRFVAKEPFGLKTGAMAMGLHNVQKSIAIQREYDPEFDALVEKLGHSQALWFLGYLLPATPWELGAAAPSFMRDVAQQGLDNQSRVDKGQEPKPIDLMSPVKKVGDYMSPFRPVFQTDRALEEVFSPEKEKPKGIAPTGATAPKGPTKASGLAPTLENSLLDLQKVLANQ